MGYLRRKIKGYTIAIGIFSLTVIVTSSGITTTCITYFDINPIRLAYGQANQMSSNSDSNNTNTNSINAQNMPAKKVHVLICSISNVTMCTNYELSSNSFGILRRINLLAS